MVYLVGTVLAHEVLKLRLFWSLSFTVILVGESGITCWMHFKGTFLITNTFTLQVINLFGREQRKHLSLFNNLLSLYIHLFLISASSY
jgi:hypothetical protein